MRGAKIKFGIRKISVPTWRNLKQWGSSRILQSSYFWIVAVPVMARTFSSISEVEISLGGEKFVLELTLPFTWQILYFAAVFFALGSLSYSFFCPRIIRNFLNHADYRNSGHGSRTLYYDLRHAVGDRLRNQNFQNWLLKEFGFLVKGYNAQPSEMNDELSSEAHVNEPELFAYTVRASDWARLGPRIFTCSFYVLGFLLLGVVFVENFGYVARAVWAAFNSS